MPGLGGQAEDEADEAAHLLTEGMVMREALLALCRELSQSMAVMEAGSSASATRSTARRRGARS